MKKIKEKQTTEELLKILAINLINHLKVIMEASGQKITDEKANNLMANIAVHILNKKFKKEIFNSK